LLGSVYRFIDEKDRIFGAQPMLTDDLHIRWRMLLVNPFAHPTVMIRREVLKQNDLRYSETAQAVEDYDLWTRMLNYTKGANLNEPLLRYRIHHKSVTSQFSEIQCRNFDAIALRTIREQLPGFVIAPEQAHQLCEVLGRGRETAPGLDLRRPALAELYLDMWAAFAQRYRGHPQLKAVQRQAVLRIAWLVWLPPLRPGWWRVMRRLLHIDPYLPGRALISAPNAVFSRLRRLALEQKRF
jgi:hypothetical protein